MMQESISFCPLKADVHKFFNKRVAQQAGQSLFKAGGSDVFRIEVELGD